MDLATLLVAGAALAPAGPGLRFIDVGQGSALLLLGAEGHAALVDSGPSAAAEAVIAALAEHDVVRVDLWIHTHFDADHVGGFARVVVGADGLPGTGDDIEVAALWDRGLDGAPDTEVVTAYAAAAGQHRQTAAAGALWQVPGLEVAAVDTGAPAEVAAENARGLALCVRVGERSALLPGDLPAAQAAIAAAACGPVDVLWASHHGSADGTSEALLVAADPALVVISAGRGNPYCHPSAVTLARLHARAVWISGLAGASPLGACPGLATVFAPDHRVLPGDLWLPAQP
jgi:beta-lactamase superfamily II metal-dependent hydrolase